MLSTWSSVYTSFQAGIPLAGRPSCTVVRIRAHIVAVAVIEEAWVDASLHFVPRRGHGNARRFR